MVNEQTSQVIGKTQFIVVSNFQASGKSAHDNLSTLLQREVERLQEKGLEMSAKARYSSSVNSVV